MRAIAIAEIDDSTGVVVSGGLGAFGSISFSRSFGVSRAPFVTGGRPPGRSIGLGVKGFGAEAAGSEIGIGSVLTPAGTSSGPLDGVVPIVVCQSGLRLTDCRRPFCQAIVAEHSASSRSNASATRDIETLFDGMKLIIKQSGVVVFQPNDCLKGAWNFLF